ncbi:MAG TPA: gephyrin-like molybdotransferase Glp [Candidatus Acidoferrales bacterium]|nr:gephyrin-like molybdotransferase Glp [Candidatus Acidoferrales bacterium]
MIRLRGFQKLVSVETALQTFLGTLRINPKETSSPLHLALNRVLAEQIIASTDLPRTNRSAVDGYAVYADSTAQSTRQRPVTLKVVCKDVINENQAKQVWTGNSVSSRADAVVMLENVKLYGDKIDVSSPVTRWENVSKKGEDVRKGQVVAERGTRLKPQHLGLIAAFGIAEVKVFQRPKIAILATGNELAELGCKLQREQVFDTNRTVLCALCSELGAQTLDLGIARDNVDEISEKLRLGLMKADAVISSGGTSVGGLDLVPETVNKVGKPGVIVHGVAMRPGMPTALAVVKNKPIIILPGNPVAAMLSFDVFGRPLLSRMLGLKRAEARPLSRARLTRRIATTLGRKNFVRVHVLQKDNDFFAEPISARGSSLISTMTRANGYVVVPENVEGLEEGDIVSVHMFDDLEA